MGLVLMMPGHMGIAALGSGALHGRPMSAIVTLPGRAVWVAGAGRRAARRRLGVAGASLKLADQRSSSLSSSSRTSHQFWPNREDLDQHAA